MREYRTNRCKCARASFRYDSRLVYFSFIFVRFPDNLSDRPVSLTAAATIAGCRSSKILGESSNGSLRLLAVDPNSSKSLSVLSKYCHEVFVFKPTYLKIDQ